jgi:hypothetical protein
MKKIEELICLSVISGFRRDVDQICALLGYYVASIGSHLLTFRDNLSVTSSKARSPFLLRLFTLEDGTDTLSRNVGIGIALDAA